MNTSPEDLSEELFRKKEARRRQLADLPFEEKLKIVVKLQQIASSIRRSGGRETQKSWELRLRSDS